ncbi:11813_t:CDS:1 [Acaulospora morrowiae]|uniref:11813_t:CDS:1 n=1 Tax=Acaulospora morrowiae TaxID=94023 RepID=A0A9N9CHK3_9GLOM|nr:11813_t:CDS:1 [Acaulospora morrowiae]
MYQIEKFSRDFLELDSINERYDQFVNNDTEIIDDPNSLDKSILFHPVDGINSCPSTTFHSELFIPNNIHPVNPFYSILTRLLDLRDNIFFLDKNDLLSRISELMDEVNNLSNVENAPDSNIQFLIATLAYQISEICNKQVESINLLSEINTEATKKLTDAYHDGLASNIQTQCSVNPLVVDDAENVHKTPTRNQIDPFATMWCIKYLIDNKLQKPNKQQRYLLSLWTNVPVHDIDRWFIRTNINYIKTNDEKTARKKLSERAKTISKQLRKRGSITNGKHRVARKAQSMRYNPY